MKTLSLSGPLALALLWVSTADAGSYTSRRLSDPYVGSSKTELVAQIGFSAYIVDHFKKPQHRWKLLPRHATCWTVESRALRRRCDYARSKLAAHRWLYGVARRRYMQLYAPKPQPVTRTSSSYSGPGVGLCGPSCVWCESRGDPQAWSPDGRYWGWYQFDSQTWYAHGAAPGTYGNASGAYQTMIASRMDYDGWPNC